MSFSNFLENELLDHIFSVGPVYTPPTIYVGLNTADPGETGANELTRVDGYYRVATTAQTWATASAGVTTNALDIQFGQASGSNWTATTHFSLWDAATGGNNLGGGALSTSKTVTVGDTAKFTAGDLSVSLD